MLRSHVAQLSAFLAQELLNVQKQHSLLQKELADIRMLHSYVAQLPALLAQELLSVQKELTDIRQDPANM